LATSSYELYTVKISSFVLNPTKVSVIAVVSAMSGETNKLIEYAEYYSKTPKADEIDMLLSSGERVLLLSVETTPAIGRNAFVYNLFIPFNTQSSVELLARPARDSDRGSGYAERR
jgi:hypothetical protein